jgi:hypothetical protein
MASDATMGTLKFIACGLTGVKELPPHLFFSFIFIYSLSQEFIVYSLMVIYM